MVSDLIFLNGVCLVDAVMCSGDSLVLLVHQNSDLLQRSKAKKCRLIFVQLLKACLETALNVKERLSKKIS